MGNGSTLTSSSSSPRNEGTKSSAPLNLNRMYNPLGGFAEFGEFDLSAGVSTGVNLVGQAAAVGMDAGVDLFRQISGSTEKKKGPENRALPKEGSIGGFQDLKKAPEKVTNPFFNDPNWKILYQRPHSVTEQKVIMTNQGAMSIEQVNGARSTQAGNTQMMNSEGKLNANAQADLDRGQSEKKADSSKGFSPHSAATAKINRQALATQGVHANERKAGGNSQTNIG